MTFRDRIPGICDRCGLRFRLKTLKEEDILGKKTGMLVCPRCYDASHPQLDTRNVRTDDKQTVRNSRSDSREHAEARKFYGFNPVGGEASGRLVVEMGRVTVTTT